MKSTARNVGVTVPNGAGEQEQEASYFTDGTLLSAAFENHDQVQQSEHGYYIGSPLPSYFPFDHHLQDPLGQAQFEWSTVYRTTVRSSTQTRHHPTSIYGTSSDCTVAGDLPYEPVLPSPISSLGSPDVPTTCNSATMIWERFPASENMNPINTFSQFHTTGQEHYQELDDEVDILEEDEFPAQSESDAALMKTSLSSSSIATGEITESSTTSDYINSEAPEMPPAKRARLSPPSPRWSTTRKVRKRKLEQNTIIFPQSPTSFAPKTSHNAIEKQYRNRLNDKFEALLSVLPAQETESGAGSMWKVSKGDVLVLAKDYIESLKTTRDELRADQKSLEDDVKGMREAWLKAGGGGPAGG